MMRSRTQPNIWRFPTAPIEIECDECGRHGRYLKAALIKRYGEDLVLPDFLRTVSGDCENRLDPACLTCGDVYPRLVPRRRENG